LSTVLIAEPAAPVSATLKKFLEGAGFAGKVVRTVDEALAQLKAAAPAILFAAASDVFDGARLCHLAKQEAPHVPVVLVYPPDVEDPDPEAARAGADACLVGPLKRGTVVSCARTMVRVRALLEQVEKLESALGQRTAEAQTPEGRAAAEARPPEKGEKADKAERDPDSPAADFEFFKRLLLMEVKRSRRYRYPVAFLLVGLDRLAEKVQPLAPAERTTVLSEALRLVTQAVRDIDLAVPFAEGRYLVFLPHTPQDGARVVATRIRERLAKLQALPGLTASVGVSGFEPGPHDAQISFGGLLKEATEALRKAQAAGGDKVEGGKSKRDRISLG